MAHRRIGNNNKPRKSIDSDFNQGILNALSVHIALLDQNGRIETVNRAWREFGTNHAMCADGSGIGLNYLVTCENARGEGADEAGKMSAGIRAVLAGDMPLFEMEYPCHSPTGRSWFRASVTPIVVKKRRCAL